jgi:hypothetical protein
VAVVEILGGESLLEALADPADPHSGIWHPLVALWTFPLSLENWQQLKLNRLLSPSVHSFHAHKDCKVGDISRGRFDGAKLDGKLR